MEEKTTSVQCLACGNTFGASLWQPRMRCPHCDALGYPDRAGYHLLPLTWECSHGHVNEGTFNFCLTCGEPLTSRCLRCEAPVYGTTCLMCGAPQEPLIRQRDMGEHHQHRFEALRTHIWQQQAQRHREEVAAAPKANHNPMYGVAGWQPLTATVPAPKPQPAPPPSPTPPQPAPQAKPAKTNSSDKFWRVIGAVLIMGGILWWLFQEEAVEILQAVNLDEVAQIVQGALGDQRIVFVGIMIAEVIIFLLLLPRIRQLTQRIFS